jgi:hypothetical protein
MTTTIYAKYKIAAALVCQRIGLRAPQPFNKHGRGPRINDLRHTFAVRTIVDWHRYGFDPDREMLNCLSCPAWSILKAQFLNES